MTGWTQSSESHGSTALEGMGSVSAFWKYCSFVLGFGLLLALAGDGPAPAAADDGGSGRVLSIGGFDSVGGQPAFVILNGAGERVGALPMVAASGDR